MELLPDFQSYLQQFYQFIPRLVAGLVVFLATAILSRWISHLVSRAMKRSNQDLEITKLIQQRVGASLRWVRCWHWIRSPTILPA